MKKQADQIDPKGAARILGTHVSTIYRLILDGKIPAVRHGGSRYLLRRDDVERYAQGEPVIPRKPLEWSRHDASAVRLRDAGGM